MALPPELLNRVNKDLKTKVDRTVSELQRVQSLKRLEQQVLDVTNQKLIDAKSQQTHLNALFEKASATADETRRAVTLEARELERVQQELQRRQGVSKDLLQKVDSVSTALETARARLQAQEAVSQRNEEAVSKWISENKTTVAAGQQAMLILAAGDARVKQLRREAELLRVQVADVEASVADQDAEIRQIRLETDDAVHRRLQLEREALELRTQHADLLARGEESELRKQSQTSRQEELDQLRQLKVAERDEASRELQDAEKQAQNQQRAISALEAKRQQLYLQHQALQQMDEELMHQIRLVETEGQVVSTTVAKKHRELELAKQNLEAARTRLTETLEKRAAVEAQLKSLEADTAGEADAQSQAATVAQRLMKEYETLEAVEMRGRMLLQDHIRKLQETSNTGDTTSDDLRLARRHLAKKTSELDALREKFAALDELVTALDNDTDAVQQKLSVEMAIRAENLMETRAIKRQEIESLRRQLEEWERAVRRSKQAVESAEAAIRSDVRTVDSAKAFLDDMEREVMQLKMDINGFHEELRALAVIKQDIASKAEGAFWELEKLKARANDKASGIVDHLRAQEEVELLGRSEIIRLESEREGRLIELHAHEEDRRRMLRNLQSTSLQKSQLQARYDDIMESMRRQLQQRETDLMTMDVGGPRKKGKSPDTPLNDMLSLVPASGSSDMTAEELEAKHILLRAVEREKLMSYGNALDDAIVTIEKRNAALDAYLGQMRAAIQNDHEQLVASANRRGGGSDMRLLDWEMATIEVSAESSAAAQQQVEQLLQDVEEERLLITGIQEAYSDEVQRRRESLQNEIEEWKKTCEALTAGIDKARATHAAKQEELEATRERRNQVREVLRALERAVDQDARETQRQVGSLASREAQHRRTLLTLDKQRVAQSNPAALVRLKMAEADEALKCATQRLQSLVLTHSQPVPTPSPVESSEPPMYFTFRRLADKYGLLIESSAALVTQACPPTAERPSSTPQQRPRTASAMPSKSRPSSSFGPDADAHRRPASRALVCAVQELDWNVASQLVRKAPTSASAASPASLLGGEARNQKSLTGRTVVRSSSLSQRNHR